MKYTVHMTTTASLSITVDVDEDAVRANLGDHADNAAVLAHAIREAAVEEAYQEVPGDVCAQCSGWGKSWSLDLGDWEVAEDEPVEATP